MRRRPQSPFLKVFGTLVFLFLYLPMFVVFIFSVNPSRSIVNFGGLSLKWYAALLSNTGLLSALLHSVEVSLIAVFFACIFGTSGAYFLSRVTFRGKAVLRTLAMLPYILPGIITGLAILVFIIGLKLELSMITVILGHMTFTTTVVMVGVEQT